VILAARLAARLDDPPRPFNQPANVNIATLVFSFVALATLWIWACLLSGFSKAIRRRLLGFSALAFAAFLVSFRYEGVSGDMLPRFVPRWAPASDEQVGKVEAQPHPAIDLSTTTPDDFPQYLGPDRTGWIAGPQLSRDWTAQPPKELWRRPIGAGWSAFSAVNGYAVTLEQRGSEEWVTCYEIATGNPVWGHSIPARHENPLGGIGPRSTPTIHNGRVYALGATGVLHCLDGATGKELWKDDLRARYGLTQQEDELMVQWGRANSPLVVDDLVVVPAGGPAGKAKNLITFRADSGQVAWESENVKEDDSSDQISYASPAIATLGGKRQIVIVNESTASGHDVATGERLWSHPWPGSSSTQANASQAAIVGNDWLLLSKGYSGGAELLEFTDATPPHPISKWKDHRLLQTKLTNVVAFEGHIFGLSEGILECVEAASGKRKWKASGGRYGHGQILGVGDLLLVLSEKGRLALVELNPQKFVELGAIQALEGKTWNNLCLYGNKLLIRNAEEAACYELP
jgi:outer membrane protein assembly factor BamB